jgi:hypothetical protein
MRSYDVAIASLAIGASNKWTDNILAQYSIPDVQTAARGVTRRIFHPALVRLAVIRELHTRLGMSVADAVRVAADMLDADAGVHQTGHLRVMLDYEGLIRALDARLAEALETAPTPRRGRPPGRRNT